MTPGRLVANEKAAERPGDFWFLAHNDADSTIVALGLLCPACGLRHYVSIAPHGSPGWAWDGNREKPTLTPSIFFSAGHVQHDYDNGCRWHGFLRAGEWVEA